MEKWAGETGEEFSSCTEAKPSVHRPFAGGEMVFHAERVTLCDVTILVNSRAKQMRRMLDELRQRTGSGAYVALSGPELIARLSSRGAKTASPARSAISARTRPKSCSSSLACGSQDVIRSGGPGYRLNEWIAVANC